jgi:hypothetical protein
MTAFGLVRPAVGDDKPARSKYCGPTGKRSAGKLACSVWSGGKAARPYLSLLEASPSALAAAECQAVRLLDAREWCAGQQGMVVSLW